METVEPIAVATPRRRLPTPVATVVVVVWRWNAEVDACLRALALQTRDDFEVIVVDNGAGLTSGLDEAVPAVDLSIVHLAENRGPSLARNVATAAARAPIVIFLDDDAEPEPGFVAGHVAAIEDGAVAVRGRVRPKEARWINRLARTYDLGDRRIPAVLNTEGNSSVVRDALIAAGGFDVTMFGFEGTELTLRLYASHPSHQIVYDPRPVIRHTYADSVRHYLEKSFRHGRMRPAIDLSEVKRSGITRASTPPHRPIDLVLVPIRLVGRLFEIAGYLVARLTRR